MNIISYGSFDLLHKGHLNVINKMRKIVGEEGKVIIGLSTKKFNKIKSKTNSESYKIRKKHLLNNDVDLVIAEKNWNQKLTDITKYKIDYFLMGSDWFGIFDELIEKVMVISVPRTKGINSSMLRNKLFDDKNEN